MIFSVLVLKLEISYRVDDILKDFGFFYRIFFEDYISAKLPSPHSTKF